MPYLKVHINRSGVKMDAGTEVEILSDHYNVMIIKDSKNQRTHVMAADLSDAPLEEIPPVVEDEKAITRKKKKNGLVLKEQNQIPLF